MPRLRGQMAFRPSGERSELGKPKDFRVSAWGFGDVLSGAAVPVFSGEPEVGDMKQLLEDIKNNRLKQAYLLCGEEAYLRLQYRDRLRDALAEPGDTMNYHYFEGKDTDPAGLIDLAETMPFFAERRVILVENSGFFKKSCDQLADYLRHLPPTAYFVFVETEVDKRGRLYKAVRDVGRAVEFQTQDEETLKKWILSLVRREGKQISGATLHAFLQKTGADMENIRQELEKVFCYTMGREAITDADIEAVCTRQVSNQIFDMVDAIALQKQQEALRLYYDLLSLKEKPMRILSLVARQFNLLLQAKELKKKGYASRQIAEKIGVPAFYVGKYISQAAGFTDRWLRNALEACIRADEAVKTGKLEDAMSVELLLISCSRGKGDNRGAGARERA